MTSSVSNFKEPAERKFKQLSEDLFSSQFLNVGPGKEAFLAFAVLAAPPAGRIWKQNGPR